MSSLKNRETAQSMLRRAVRGATPSMGGMFSNVHPCSAPQPASRTNPSPVSGRVAGPVCDDTRTPVDAAPPDGSGAKCSEMFRNVQFCSAPKRSGETKPIAPGLSPRQRSAARLLVGGRTARGAAAELGVEEHTIGRWRKLPAFAREVDRLQRVLVETSAPRRAGRS